MKHKEYKVLIDPENKIWSQWIPIDVSFEDFKDSIVYMKNIVVTRTVSRK